LEAALAGKPVICFERSGGMPEFVRDDAGFTVPYLDTTQMAEKTRFLLDNPAEAHQRGAVGQRRVREHHTIATIGPEMYNLIQPHLASRA